MIAHLITLEFMFICTVGPPLLFWTFHEIRLEIRRAKDLKDFELHMQVLAKILEIDRILRGDARKSDDEAGRD